MVLVALAIAGGGCSSDPDDATPERSRRRPTEAAEVTKVAEHLQPGNPTGFDPAAWGAATDPAAVLPAGSTVSVAKDSAIVDGDDASVDLVVTAPGAAPARHWVFLHQVDGKWLVYGSLPLDVAP